MEKHANLHSYANREDTFVHLDQEINDLVKIPLKHDARKEIMRRKKGKMWPSVFYEEFMETEARFAQQSRRTLSTRSEHYVTTSPPTIIGVGIAKRRNEFL
jgi:hypothetical protein